MCEHLSPCPTIEESNKRAKIESTPSPIELPKCQYIKPKNGKKCRLQVRKGQTYCFAHISVINGNSKEQNGKEDPEKDLDDGITRVKRNGNIVKRVKCTIDPSHTVWEDKLSLHLKKCNVLKKRLAVEEMEKSCSWFSIDYNVKDAEGCNVEEKTIDNNIWKTCIDTWVKQHDEVYAEQLELPLRDVNFKDGLEGRFAEVTNQKHIKQQSSLIGQLVEFGLVSKKERPEIVIEFGCGRAEFTRYLNKAMAKYCVDETTKEDLYLFVDRENPRLKFDTKMGEDVEKDEDGGRNVMVERLKVDIKDLILAASLKELHQKAKSGKGNKKYIGISKHLCGVATDLTLRCLENAVKDSNLDLKFAGCLVAMCCRHGCKYEWLLEDSKQYLKEKFDIDHTNFIYFRKMFAWATNGVAPGKTLDDGADCHFTGMSFRERENVGLKMRRILDESRKYAMERKGFDVSLLRYVSRGVSLENNCIVIKSRETV